MPSKQLKAGTVIVDEQDADILERPVSIIKGTYSVHVRVEFAGKQVRLSRLLAAPPSGMVVDHINGNPLDNRRSNLRVCTVKENNWNRKRRVGGTSLYKGVSRAPNGWFANIWPHGKCRHLGRFKSEIDAARAYDEAAREEYGEFACLNFPAQDEQSALRPNFHAAQSSAERSQHLGD